uniref:DUF3782 domain-containing protein n=1 Tax=Candidatus Kentrum sp. DK TaxID=2126562 RepID=A0A450S3H3_9GAMM|nr:MAG: hypothetical protein BECKDK2373C_GA0170839_101425 [Candidatus Kentron sp. DK]
MTTITAREPTPESVWAFMQETAQQMRETDRQMQETDRILHELGQETDRRMQETDRKMQETDRRLKKAERLFTTQWGRLIESLVEGRLLQLFHQRGISVYDTSTRVKGNRDGRSYEFDIIAHDGDKIVIVEVKTTLRPDDVRKFIGKLKDTKTLMPRYRDNVIHGAVAWLQADAGADEMAINQGLFSVRAVGDSAWITNAPGFVPGVF